jgi:uncharacterized membrane protein
MTMSYLALKTIHILSSTLLFGTGLGTAFHLWASHLRGDVRAIASTARNVVLADWLFIATSGIVQPATGLLLARAAGYDMTASWLVATYALYALAGICWLGAVRLQMNVAAISARCAQSGTPLPPAYHRAMNTWFWLGWPAFISLLTIFGLMVCKPDLW